MVSLYGMKWDSSYSALDVEMECIRRGGLKEGLPFHYEKMRKLLWPELDDHRWHRLCRDNILSHKVTVLLGPGSSGKTHEASWIYLCEYFCFPDETLVMVSSTDMRGLQLRVFGEIKMLFEKAKDRYPHLPGNILESKCAICTDSVEEDRIRDMRKGVIGIPTVQNGKMVGLGKWVGVKQKRIRLVADECFPAGSMVDTDKGEIPIELVKVGDLVRNPLGLCRVKNTMSRVSKRLVRVHLSDGRSITCTSEHRVFTQFGWESACHLGQSHYMLSPYEAMHVLQYPIPTHKQREVLSCLQGVKDMGGLQTVSDSVQKAAPKLRFDVLQSVLLVEVSSSKSRVQEEVLHRQKIGQDSSIYTVEVSTESRSGTGNETTFLGEHDQIHELLDSRTERDSEDKHESHLKGDGAQTENPRRKWNRPNEGGICIAPLDSGFGSELRSQNRQESRIGLSTMLQGRCGYTGIEVRDRGRRKLSLSLVEKSAGHEKNSVADGAWVDRLEVIEQEDLGGHGERDSGIHVYNLEVEGHPSYTVNGFLVHNCQAMSSSFLSAFANLDKNVDFKAVCIGNPNDPLDPLGKAAEPLDGWSGHLEPKKTEVWKTRFMNGVCVNLIGTDSPNFDFPPDKPARYPYLISREKIANTLSFFPKDSVEYMSQCVGAMKVGVLARRVITRDLCAQFGAREEVIWDGSGVITKVFGLDAAYGGDRCVGGHVEFGPAFVMVNGHRERKIVINVSQPQLVPTRLDPGRQPEDNIADWIKDYCSRKDIPPKNVFHDSTGRGGLGTAIARVFSAECNPVEFGGSPSKRPVSLDLMIWDHAEHQRRPMRCDEHYSKFVTELWYSIRYAIEGSQLRGLPEDVMDEMCMREWDKTRNNKIEVETKRDMKERIGRSPDLGDWLAICVEGCRRLGFQLSKLGNEESTSADSSWIYELNRRADNLRDRRTLVFNR